MIAFHVAKAEEWFTAGADSFDHVLTDPPYPEHVQREGVLLTGTKGPRQRGAVQDVSAGFDPLTDLAFVAPLVALARRWSLFHCSLESLGDYRRASERHWIRSCIYHKARAMPQLTADRPGSRCEGMALFHNTETKKAWNRGGKHNTFYANPANRKETLHPTGKPLALCMAIVEAFTLPGELIADPFCGTGTYGLACYLLGRRYVGGDTDPAHIASAKLRLANLDTAKELARYEASKDKEKGWNPDD